MVEVINKIIKVFAALSLQILSLSLLMWVFNLDMHFSFWHIALILGVGLLVYLFVGYSLSLFKQVFARKPGIIDSEILDEEEIERHKKNDQ